MTVHQVVPDAFGELSVDGRNTFDLLREHLYTEPGVVFRELVSNALDAVTKRSDLGEPGYQPLVEVELDTVRRLLVFRDNGIGMDADEVDRYLNRIARSGTAEFVEQLSDRAPATIGHFGVGFYSAFMLAATVEVDTLRATGGAAVHWRCSESMNWESGVGEREAPGTSVLLHLATDSAYLTDPGQVEQVLRSSFAFPPVPVQVRVDGGDAVVVGDPDPVWRRGGAPDPAELQAFYRSHFGELDDALGWVRLESPELGLRGMVFLRDTRGGAESIDGRVEIYSRGVFVDANLPRLVPKFVNLQHAVIECDDLPLVVSRGQVRDGGPDDVTGLVAECLSQELAIALHAMFTHERERYELLWPELAPFVKYGVLTDRIFASVMTRRVLFAGLDGSLHTIAEHLDLAPQTHPGTVYYVSDPIGQAAYAEAFQHAGVPALVLDHVIDQPLLQRLEAVMKDVRFTRLDADIARTLAGDPDPADADLAERVVDRFQRFASERLPGAGFTAVWLKVPDLSVVLSSDEDSRRLSDLAQMGGLLKGHALAELAVPRTLVANLRNPLVRSVGTSPEPVAAVAAAQLADLTLLGHDELSPESLLGFLARSQEILAGYLAAGTNE